MTNATVGGDGGPFYTPYILDPQNAGELLVGTCRVWRGSTGGSAFSTLSIDFDTLSNTTCTGNEINLVRGLAAGGPKQNTFSNVVYATTEGSGPNSGNGGGGVWVTTNAATTQMTAVSGAINPLHYTISFVAVDAADTTGKTAYVSLMGFVGAGNQHIWKTTNAGQNWVAFGSTTTGLPDSPVNTLLVDSDSGLIYAGTDVGVFVSSTSAANWTELGPDAQPGATGYLPNVPVSALRLFSAGGTKELRVSTYGRGIWRFTLALTPDYQVAVSNSPLSAFPSQAALFMGTLKAINGYSSPVTLSCGTGAPGACTFPLGNPITPTDGGASFSVSMDAGASIADYNFNVHAVGSDVNTITHDAPVTLHVVDFGITAPSPNTVTAAQGGNLDQRNLPGDGFRRVRRRSDAELSGRFAHGSRLPFRAIEYGESNVRKPCHRDSDGEHDGKHSGWNGHGHPASRCRWRASAQTTDLPSHRRGATGLQLGRRRCAYRTRRTIHTKLRIHGYTRRRDLHHRRNICLRQSAGPNGFLRL